MKETLQKIQQIMENGQILVELTSEIEMPDGTKRLSSAKITREFLFELIRKGLDAP